MTYTPQALDHQDPRAVDAFELWSRVGYLPARRGYLTDWLVESYADTVCFSRPGTHDAFMVSDSAILHFGFDTDDYASAYATLQRTTRRETQRQRHQVNAALRNLLR